MFGNTLKALIAAAVLATFASSAFARPELNAFINRPANTVPELIAQMKSDPVIMDRYMRHFGMTRSEVSLRLGTIARSGNYTVYSVPENGAIKVHTSFFAAGTPAFVDAMGMPILRIKCGNPFVRGPRVTALSTPLPVGSEAMELRPVTEAQTIIEPLEYSPVLLPPTLEELPVDAVAPVPVLPTEPAIQTSSPQIFGALPVVLGGIGAAAIFTGGGSGSKTAPVPEPASMLILGGGALALLARRRRR